VAGFSKQKIMRQALIVKNPKWELFSTVSDEFKSLSGNAVLVVRGRSKEKKAPNQTKSDAEKQKEIKK
jgi:hypothetical protein